MFMELQRTGDIAHHVQFVAFSTGFGVTGVWKVPENQGELAAFHIPEKLRRSNCFELSSGVPSGGGGGRVAPGALRKGRHLERVCKKCIQNGRI